MSRVIAGYGSWSSPLSAEKVASAAVGLAGLQVAGHSLYWTERRPDEGGRSVVVEWRDGKTRDRTPAPFNARTRAHEYGGGTFADHGEDVYFTNFTDGRIYRQPSSGAAEPLTAPAQAAYADLVIDPQHQRLIAVRESYSGDDEPVASIVAFPLEGSCHEAQTLVAGADFYSSPAVHPNGRALAYLSWSHPNMPWDETRLELAPLDTSGALGEARTLAGGDQVSIFQPLFRSDGALFYVSDVSGWWNLYRLDDPLEGEPERAVHLAARSAEFGRPQWIFGYNTYDFTPDGQLFCCYTQQGLWHLGRLDEGDSFVEIPTSLTQVETLRCGPDGTYLVAAAPDRSPHVTRIAPGTDEISLIHRSSAESVSAQLISAGEPIEFPAKDGSIAHAFYYAPCSDRYEAPEGELPPLIVKSHGGPTAAADNAFSPAIQFWTTRGFAVVDVNYGGSTGYGRSYRERLDGNWGIVDVDDCVAAAEHLVANGLADPQRLAIRGGSAGGYTTLAALTFRDTFRAGASYYGIGDLEALVRDTHKFESRYLDRLIGPHPETRDLYIERAPLHHADRLSCPVIFFQGQDDKVVPPNQAETMVEALREKQIPVAYIAFDGEGHGFRRAENIIRSLEAELAFYAQVFGFEPADDIEPVDLG